MTVRSPLSGSLRVRCLRRYPIVKQGKVVLL
jgi:hypothetical protein